MIRATLCSGARAFLASAVLAAVFCGPAIAQQGEPAMTRRATELRDAPGDSGRSLASLPVQEPLTRLAGRQGPYIQVQNRAGVTGWVHMFDVGPASGPAAAPAGDNIVSGGLRGISSLLRGGSTPRTSVATSTIGIRGLEAEDLARAQPNLRAVTDMEKLRQPEGGAREFAAEASLAAANVPALPAPSRRGPATGGNPNPAQQ